MQNISINKILSEAFNDSPKLNLVDEFEKKAAEYNLSATQAKELLGIEYKSLYSILTGESKQPNLINVLKIAEFLEIDMDTIIKVIISNQSPDNVAKLETANKTSFINKRYDLDRLYKEKFLNSKTDIDKISNRLISFFGFQNLYELEEFTNKSAVLFSQSKRSFGDKMRKFAIESAYRLFELINNPNEYDRAKLKDLIPKIKPYCMDVEKGLYTVCRALYNLGVTVIFQRHLTTSQFKGATFIVNGKPCIVLTDLNNKYPTIWHAFIHELYHVLFDLDEIKHMGYHLTGQEQPEIFLETNEMLADEFAGDYFFSYELYRFIKPQINNEYLVSSYAKKNNIDPSFIYRAFQYHINKEEGKDYWKAFNQYFPSVDKATNRLNPLSWKSDLTLPQVAETIKEIFELNKLTA